MSTTQRETRPIVCRPDLSSNQTERSAVIGRSEVEHRVADQLHKILGLDNDHVVIGTLPFRARRRSNGEDIIDDSLIKVLVGGPDTGQAGDASFVAVEDNGFHELPTLQCLGEQLIGKAAVEQLVQDVRLLHQAI